MSTPTCSREGAARDELADYHPLEIIPFFRRFRSGTSRDIAYTFIWNGLLGTAFWIVGMVFGGRWLPLSHLLFMLLLANTIGYTIHLLFIVGGATGLERRSRGRGSVATAIYYSGVSTLGVLAGSLLIALAFDNRFFDWLRNPRWFAGIAFSSVVISVLLCAIFFARASEARAEVALQGARLRSERMEREAALANLRALQAQIEPHFLFNTLANVASLIDTDPATSKRMLERFIGFLRASLGATRAETTTLGAEAELIRAYLDVLQVRMGGRLRYAIDIDPGLAQFEMPPMLLQPVVENAIRHGLEPKVDGGEVRVEARHEDGGVAIVVSDTGIGFAPTTQGGLGLTNLRDRLRLLFGSRGTLAISEAAGGGTRVEMRIPA